MSLPRALGPLATEGSVLRSDEPPSGGVEMTAGAALDASTAHHQKALGPQEGAPHRHSQMARTRGPVSSSR